MGRLLTVSAANVHEASVLFRAVKPLTSAKSAKASIGLNALVTLP